ncbi:MAG TPA: indolepyruvate oxidoreductase subunit beta family protein [Stellaceae bacterium]|nr:indolepyruvate oxidoreductase subunit beta family protein [Stellaceae bacterium]
MNLPLRPITILIAALGGEGGGVLANWIVAAAQRRNFPAQSTSIPGVAQRTGATTYYIEILPVDSAALGERRPILALMPGPGEVDVLLASELVEASRAAAAGFVTPDRTTLIAATSRSYLMPEKTAMADGRIDSVALVEQLHPHARHSLFLDMESLAREAGAFVNAVMLGALAGSAALPIADEDFAAAIRAEGKAAEANLRGFRAGSDAARAAVPVDLADAAKRWRKAAASLESLEAEAANLPEPARDIVVEGLRRLVDYQGLAYAARYLARLVPIAAADTDAGLNGVLLREAARHLALRMSFEDVMRVAQAKIDPARLARIRAEVAAQPGEKVRIVEYFKPGIDEVCSVLPSSLARPLLALAERRGWLGRVYWGMEIETTTILGYLRLKLLAGLRAWRPRSHRFREEQREIEAWLAAIRTAARFDGALALEIVECARLIKGYGDTHKRGTANYRAIFERIIRPALAGRTPPALAADGIASARIAALADPDGARLHAALTEIDRRVTMSAAAE